MLDPDRARELTTVCIGETILIATSGHLASSPDRRGQIVDVLGEGEDESYFVRWPDGRVSVVPPAAVTVVTGSPAERAPRSVR